jgi:hypothetical protein
VIELCEKVIQFGDLPYAKVIVSGCDGDIGRISVMLLDCCRMGVCDRIVDSII